PKILKVEMTNRGWGSPGSTIAIITEHEIPVSVRHNLQDQRRETHGVTLEIFDGPDCPGGGRPRCPVERLLPRATELDAPSRSCQPANPRCRLQRTKELLRSRRPAPRPSIH